MAVFTPKIPIRLTKSFAGRHDIEISLIVNGAKVGWVSLDTDEEEHQSLRDIEWVVVAGNSARNNLLEWSFCVLLVTPSGSGDGFRRRGSGMIYGDQAWLTKSKKKRAILV